jgi:hypothetical protein
LNTYTGDTTVEAGTLVLAEGAQLRFRIGANGDNTTLTGNSNGTATLGGVFALDLAGADTTSGNSWTLVDGAALDATFGDTFSLLGFTEAAGVHTYDDGTNIWTFTEENGKLTVAASQAGFANWIGGFGLDLEDQDPTDDADDDGLDNAIEWVLGGNPALPETGLRPTASTTATGFVFSFIRDRQSLTADTTTEIDLGTDLATWPEVFTVGADTEGSSAGVSVTDNFDGTDTVTLTVTLTVTRAPETRRFARLKVTIHP